MADDFEEDEWDKLLGPEYVVDDILDTVLEWTPDLPPVAEGGAPASVAVSLPATVTVVPPKRASALAAEAAGADSDDESSDSESDGWELSADEEFELDLAAGQPPAVVLPAAAVGTWMSNSRVRMPKPVATMTPDASNFAALGTNMASWDSVQRSARIMQDAYWEKRMNTVLPDVPQYDGASQRRARAEQNAHWARLWRSDE